MSKFGSPLAKSLTARKMSDADAVAVSAMRADDPLPLLLEAREQIDLERWIAGRREWLHRNLIKHGGLLFRGFEVDSAARFGAAARALTPDLLDYLERAAVRTEVAPGVFTSTELAADQIIPHHHEMSYSHNWPRYIWFFAAQLAQAGGATPIASERRFFPRLSEEIKGRFLEHGVMYVRNYGDGLDLSWQRAFQTESREDVEDYCRRFGVEFEWSGEAGLSTRQIRQAVAKHPETGETVWFNHAHLFHESNLAPDLRAPLLDTFGSAGLPRNAYYGDGAPIEDAVLDEIRAGYDACSLSFPWQAGDVLLLDNYLSVHGRETYLGPRRVLVTMAQLCDIGGVVQ
jgi:alpha-ketoglutarate-dependent taurine dioxygenase